LSAEPSHHYLLENEYVNMLNVEIPPNRTTQRHRHLHDFVTVAFGAAELSNEAEGSAPDIVKLQNGEARFTTGGLTHLVRNLASTSFRGVTIELLQDDVAHKAAAPRWDEEVGTATAKGSSREILFVKDGVRVSNLVLQPGKAEPTRHQAKAEILVAITDLALGKGDSAVQLKAGEVQWRGGRHTGTLTNVAKQVAKLVLLEFK
jgi:quercetin dioxygenase-like cupin family protein